VNITKFWQDMSSTRFLIPIPNLLPDFYRDRLIVNRTYHSGFKVLSPSIGQLKNLEVFHFCNRIPSLPNELFTLTNLTGIDKIK
jgi:hypothetical protein